MIAPVASLGPRKGKLGSRSSGAASGGVAVRLSGVTWLTAMTVHEAGADWEQKDRALSRASADVRAPVE